MRLRYDSETEEFRAEFVQFLAENLPPESERAEPKRSSGHLPDWARTWQRTLFDGGWLVPGWPPQLGGRNATPVQTMVYFEELTARRVPRALNPQGLGIVAPSLLQHGTPEQQERWLLPTLRGEITWCLGMSEPDAGSDLGALRTRADLVDGTWRVSGQKVWTSGAHDADLCFCFVRTEPEQPKHRGISVLVVDMAAPGVTCRPLADLTAPDFADFNEVFFDEVPVGRDALIGERGRGWSISMSSLGHERGMLWIGQQTALAGDVQSLLELCRQRPDLGGSERVRDAVVDLYTDAEAMKLLGYLGFAKFAQGQAAPEHSILKLFGSEAQQRLRLLANQALGADALDRDLVAPVDDVRPACWGAAYLQSFAHTIAGGTSEIQRNIVSERVLGLPRA